jgi:hypothetical protein
MIIKESGWTQLKVSKSTARSIEATDSRYMMGKKRETPGQPPACLRSPAQDRDPWGKCSIGSANSQKNEIEQ